MLDRVFYTTGKKRRDQMARKIEQEIGDDTVCYVLITCKRADASGNMSVKLTYEGDEALASHLLATAYHQGSSR